MVTNDVLKNGFEIFFKPFLDGYRDRVNSIYSEENEISSCFEFMKPVELHVLLRTTDTYLVFVRGETDKLIFHDCSDIPASEYLCLGDNISKFVKSFLSKNFDINEYLEKTHYYRIGNDSSLIFEQYNIHLLPERSKEWGRNYADNHYHAYELERILIDITKPSTSLLVVDTEEILKRVKDPSFQYEFGESAKAYNNGLYLAAAATAGIALENILRLLIIKHLGSEKLPKQTYIHLSIKVLDEVDVIPGRLRAEVLKHTGVRNANAHTNKDPVRKETVESLFRIIDELSTLL